MEALMSHKLLAASRDLQEQAHKLVSNAEYAGAISMCGVFIKMLIWKANEAADLFPMISSYRLRLCWDGWGARSLTPCLTAMHSLSAIKSLLRGTKWSKCLIDWENIWCNSTMLRPWRAATECLTWPSPWSGLVFSYFWIAELGNNYN